MDQPRKIRRVFKSKPVLEGAGVHLNRAFGFSEVPHFDPFLLLDDFRSATPDHYLQGFPWHPHRGIETITYVLTGDVEHGDSMGNKGDITSGDVQWMTAGNGIIHQEMPKGDSEGRMEGFQLWANLPAARKMMPPRYRDVKASQIPLVATENGIEIKIICGRVGNVAGPVTDIVIDPQYLDITVPPNTTFTHPTTEDHTVFAYVIEGNGSFSEDRKDLLDNRTLVLYENGANISVHTGHDPVRFLLISGKPIGEPVAWQGPIVMNTREELQTAFEEYHNGTFVKHEVKM
ncbi:MAG: pirin family protein [Proteobacteria bacterium]|nr:pirin family protein [Pseudomonadota bacterium]MBU1739169.1 pirin family protein [Pseudomonadota bacterium]